MAAFRMTAGVWIAAQGGGAFQYSTREIQSRRRSARRLAGHVEDLDLVDGLELRVGEGPYDLLVAGDFKKERLLAEVAVAAVVAKDGVAVRQPLRAGHEAKRVAGHVVFVQLPDGFFLRVELDDLVPGDPHEVVPLADGHLLVTCGDGHKVIELDAQEKTVWELNENDVPDRKSVV